jgi:hypothetical protein
MEKGLHPLSRKAAEASLAEANLAEANLTKIAEVRPRTLHDASRKTRERNSKDFEPRQPLPSQNSAQ